ncbi:hypothetical protein PR048_008423 [Dryococelus australis]|uniref:Uncharacterized protein n=1 Tax=Dryococelus australis TaxID=614101 RepID=A0ABQ9HX34_9NEOP|nr:hypothetical protein PR048_008423 [Dryococelus australis]
MTKLHVYLRYESMARRGANEIALCVCRAILDLPEEIKHVVLYSDSCPGQNKNTPFLATCLYVLQEKKIEMLDHKFMVPGHSRMECEVTMLTQISHPHDWAQLIRMAGKKKTFNVIELTQEDFCDYASLLRTDIQMGTSNEDGEKFLWQQVRWLRYVLDKPTKVPYKTYLKGKDTFSVIDMTPRRQQPHSCLKQNKCYNNVVPIYEAKKIFYHCSHTSHLFFMSFYKNLKTEMDLTDPICDSDEEN